MLDFQHGQVKILGTPLPQDATGARLSHLVSVGTSNHWPLGSAHMLTASASIHAQVGELVAGARQQLGCVAAAEVCAYAWPHAARTRLCPPPGSTSLSHDARVLTNLACGHDPTDTCVGD